MKIWSVESYNGGVMVFQVLFMNEDVARDFHANQKNRFGHDYNSSRRVILKQLTVIKEEYAPRHSRSVGP